MATIYKTEKSNPDFKWTENLIAKKLALCGACFDYTKNLVAVPNVSHGFLDWEADMLLVSKAGYLSEVEIKTSLADWKSDIRKDKWMLKAPGTFTGWRHADSWKEFEESEHRRWGWGRIKYFWYAVPKELSEKRNQVEIPSFAGIVAVNADKGFVDIVKPAETIKVHRKLKPEEILKLARLGCMRIWGGL